MHPLIHHEVVVLTYFLLFFSSFIYTSHISLQKLFLQLFGATTSQAAPDSTYLRNKQFLKF